jgi:uncharacterized Fe-S cluster protein YjdI
MDESEKTYTNGEISVIWTSGLCTHSAKCVRGLGDVFNVQARSWINMGGASTDRIILQVEHCPSRALSYFRNEKSEKAAG